jgi:CRISPR/Cas system-associated endonuclease Cas1
MFFMHRIRRTNATYDKGIEVKETLDAAKQSYHAYLGAYAYNHDENTDFVNAMISNDNGAILYNEVWQDTPAAQE